MKEGKNINLKINQLKNRWSWLLAMVTKSDSIENNRFFLSMAFEVILSK